MLAQSDLLPGINHTFWDISKESILYVGGKKIGPFLKSWRGQVVRVIHHKSVEATDRAQNVILII